MTASDVLQLYGELEQQGIPICIDGGWCVDALLGRQTRAHPDLDIAVERPLADRLERFLIDHGFQKRPGPHASAWNYSMEQQGRVVDVHVFEFDENGRNIYGVQYPLGSLDGHGLILHSQVRCVGPEWMFRFKTAYPPREKDLQDVNHLAARFGFEIPSTHLRSGRT